MNHRIVSARPGWHPYLYGTILLVLVSAALFYSYEHGREQSGFDWDGAMTRLHALEDERDALLDQIDELRGKNALLERTGGVDAKSYELLKLSVAEMQDEILELKEELAFYRGILDPGEEKQGLRVQGFEVERQGSGPAYRYKLVLTQVLNNNTPVSGNVTFSVTANKGGKQERLELKALTSDGEENKSFKFRYFQNLEGTLTIPKGYVPRQVNITVTPSGRRYKNFTKTVDWPQQES